MPSASNLLRRLAKGQRLRLGKKIGQEYIVVAADRVERLENAMKSQGMSLVP